MKMEDVRRHCGAPDFSSVDDQAVHAGNRITGTTPRTRTARDRAQFFYVSLKRFKIVNV
jgi:hypothetical protein